MMASIRTTAIREKANVVNTVATLPDCFDRLHVIQAVEYRHPPKLWGSSRELWVNKTREHRWAVNRLAISVRCNCASSAESKEHEKPRRKAACGRGGRKRTRDSASRLCFRQWSIGSERGIFTPSISLATADGAAFECRTSVLSSGYPSCGAGPRKDLGASANTPSHWPGLLICKAGTSQKMRRGEQFL